ncbi:branched-chain amino acid ABC transporter permease [Halosegnis longus]|uniref:Branched-chain amino acid ABC transporter permease n=1 Tax=Halosegnis longus TaxID=2216012 RepID=A0AAJ4R8P4_9EURY|nr:MULTISPECIES: branched-chain amino acid ABC transporter permease [Halobacteriales]RNJ26277.1 branched-chain amino acid ABC transporter permease [Salella cibi]
MGASAATARSRELLARLALVLTVGGAAVLLLDLLAQLARVDLWILGGELAFSQLVTYLWTGLILGLIIGLAGVGLSLTYSILNFANFAHGDYLTLGAFSGWSVAYVIAGLGTIDLASLILVDAPSSNVGASVTSTPVAVIFGLLAAIIVTIVLGLGLDRVVYKPMRNSEGISLLIASIGVAFILRYLAALIFGTGRRGVTAAGEVPSMTLLGVSVNAHQLTIVVVAIVAMLAIHLLLQRTKIGKAMRAMADNRDLARITGIPTERMITATWVLGSGLAGASGYMLVLTRGTLGFNDGYLLLLLIFAAVILGGIGSVYGAIVGGLLIGITSRVALVWVPGEFGRPVAFGLMILLLLFRPSGLFGGVETA